jgi:hypothetical protein
MGVPVRRDINISIFLTCLWFCLAAMSYGQSLGDVAREERLKKQNQNPQTQTPPDQNPPGQNSPSQNLQTRTPQSQNPQTQDPGNESPQTAHKVFTNEDLASGDNDEDAEEPVANAQHHDSPSRPLGSKSAAQWKAEIAKQRSMVTSLQNQIEKVNASIHFAPGNCVRNCVEHNEHQVEKQDQVQRMQEQLEEAKKTLDDLQEGARREGFGNAVWEP